MHGDSLVGRTFLIAAVTKSTMKKKSSDGINGMDCGARFGQPKNQEKQ